MAVVSLKVFLNASKSPKSVLICAAISPVGSPPPLGFMICQNMVWFDVAAAVVLHDRAHIFRNCVEILDQLLGRLLAQFGMLLDRAVQVRDVGLVVLVVVQLHGRLVDGGLEGGVVVRERRKFVSHKSNLLLCDRMREQRSTRHGNHSRHNAMIAQRTAGTRIALFIALKRTVAPRLRCNGVL